MQPQFAIGPPMTPPPSDVARRRLHESDASPLFIADWRDAVFIHYRIAPRWLASHVPFPLDCHNGWAYVSVVAFTQRDLRPGFGGRLAAALVSPIANHPFLNVRTYVRLDGEPAIFFLSEWLPNRLAVMLGPRTFGLPYRLGRLCYQNATAAGRLVGDVIDASGAGRFTYFGTACAARPSPAGAGSLTEFLLERYTCFTHVAGRCRRFRIWHAPWPQRSATLDVLHDSLLFRTGAWRDHAMCVGAHCSPGVSNVEIGRPHRVSRAQCRGSISMS